MLKLIKGIGRAKCYILSIPSATRSTLYCFVFRDGEDNHFGAVHKDATKDEILKCGVQQVSVLTLNTSKSCGQILYS